MRKKSAMENNSDNSVTGAIKSCLRAITPRAKQLAKQCPNMYGTADLLQSAALRLVRHHAFTRINTSKKAMTKMAMEILKLRVRDIREKRSSSEEPLMQPDIVSKHEATASEYAIVEDEIRRIAAGRIEVEQIVRWRLENMTAQEIAERSGKSIHQVHRFLRKLNEADCS
ncbi:hypothetical protein [Calycomorphotria hydatis]|uniref:hypothetical protein n=1 Tax=Calycomorphotria hydatis TaxID=2528027 RepID=UPI00119E2B04|nr:hypothetical protein [Calycomorphotria hydatis]